MVRALSTIAALCLSTLRYATLVEAVDCDAGSSGYIIASQDDADELKQCPLLSGDVHIQADSNTTEIQLNGVQNITGRLQFGGNRLDNFAAADLVAVDSLIAQDVAPKSMEFSSLTTIGSLFVEGEDVHSISFAAGLTSWVSDEPGSIHVKNTNITTLEGINFAEIENIVIYENGFLADLTIPAKTIGAGGGSSMMIYSNGQGNHVVNTSLSDFSLSFPHLETLKGIALLETLSALSMPKLQKVSGKLTLVDLLVSSLSFPALVSLAGSKFSIQAAQVGTLSFPALVNASELFFDANNASTYSELANLPNLQHMDSISIESGNTDMAGLNCSSWKAFVCNGTINDVKCMNNVTYEGQTNLTCPTTTSSGSRALTNDIYMALLPGMIMLALGLVGTVL